MNTKIILWISALSVVILAGCGTTSTPTPNELNDDIANNTQIEETLPETDVSEEIIEDTTDTQVELDDHEQTTEDLISIEQVAEHNTANDCRTIVNNNVYDVTSWISQHPGWTEAIEQLCGTDGSELFNNQHGGMEPQEQTLETFQIGELE